MAFADIIRDRLRKFLHEPGDKKSTENIPKSYGDLPGFAGGMYKAYYDSLKQSTKRTQRYDEYQYLDRHLAEASATLNIYSDNIVSGAIGGEENYSLVIDEKTPGIESIARVVEEAEKRTGIKDYIWDIARDTICFGDDWEENIIVEKNKKVFVERLKALPVKQMHADIDEHGRWKNPEKPYVQKVNIIDKTGIPFDWWRVIHFKVGRGIYGVERSIFANASRRIGRQLLWIDDAAIIARLSRAYTRLAFFVDTSGLSMGDKFRFAEEFLERIRRKEIVERSTGRVSPIDVPWAPDEDIAIPVEKDSPQDIKVLTGDLNMGNISDIKYFQEKFFMALNMPKQYASKEEGVKAKATIGQLDVQFARQVRRKQAALKPGLKSFYRLVFYLAEIDPDMFRWDIVFPPMATMDELLKWEMEKVKAEIAKTYAVDIGATNSLWVFEKVLGYSKEEMRRYSLVNPDEMGKSSVNIPPEVAAMVRKDPQLRWALEDLKDLAAWKLNREKELDGKVDVGVEEREESLSDKWR